MDTNTASQISNGNPLFNSIVLPALVSLFTTLTVAVFGAVIWWFKKHWESKQEEKREIVSKEKEAFSKMLEHHSNMFASFNSNSGLNVNVKLEDTFPVVRELLVWSSDDVLREYSLYLRTVFKDENNKLSDREMHFGKAILAFRKQLGYKNKDITPEYVAIVFKAFWQKGII